MPNPTHEELVASNKALKEENKDLKKRVAGQAKRIAELEKCLARYESAHTPPSLSGVHLSRVGGNKKPGRRKGCEGAGRKTPDVIHKRKSIKLKSCPRCGGRVKARGNKKTGCDRPPAWQGRKHRVPRLAELLRQLP